MDVLSAFINRVSKKVLTDTEKVMKYLDVVKVASPVLGGLGVTAPGYSAVIDTDGPDLA